MGLNNTDQVFYIIFFELSLLFVLMPQWYLFDYMYPLLLTWINFNPITVK